MANIIPDGYELLAGRNRANATKALELAADRGFDVTLVRTVAEGYLIPGAESEDEAPEGEPDESWKVADIDAYADANGIDLSGASKKADKIAAIAAAKEGE